MRSIAVQEKQPHSSLMLSQLQLLPNIEKLYSLQHYIDLLTNYSCAKLYFSTSWRSKIRTSNRSHCLLETFVMIFTVFCAASAFNLLPVANWNKLLVSCFCSFGLNVFVKDSSKATKSWVVILGRDIKT